MIARATAAVATALALGLPLPAAAQTKSDGKASPEVARGRYLVQVGGCNDCHTPGYGPRAGKVPEAEWLVGDALGFKGPWGTTYPTNLRLYFKDLTEAEWLKRARTVEMRPPMPWFNLRAMTDADLKAIWHYVRAAGPAGQPAPAALPPGGTPNGPVVQFPG